jgi:thiamine biosynthesis lipoprotein
MEQIHNLMSVHDPDSELSRLNREALRGPVGVGPLVFEVVRRALQIASESGGAFDPTVAPLLAEWGLLPSALRRKKAGSWRDLLLLPGSKIQFLKPLALDLGGIAKGFAVDSAVESLMRSGVKRAVVNAGGDLRVFGGQSSTICLRHPAQPQLAMEGIQLRDSALATSSPCFTQKRWHGKLVSHLVNMKTRDPIIGAKSVSVKASECWVADALTKVVLNAPQRANGLLSKYTAEALVLSA